MQTYKRITLILGGARSGKSWYAERLAGALSGTKVYLATAQSGDAEMADRIRRHRERRGGEWRTVEEPLALAAAIEANATARSVILIDCLTLWLTNVMLARRDIEFETRQLLESLENALGSIILVSNEVGQGIVPDNALARAFGDEAGRLNQTIAEAADRVVLVTAGLPLALKGELVTL